MWIGTKNWNGYGQVRLDNQWVMAHRAVWEHFRGPIPEDMQVDHMCGVRLCCNVDHLRVVTPRENCLANTSNSMGAQNSRKTECPICGGPFTVKPNGHRYCKACWLRRSLAYQRKYRAQKWTEEEYCRKQAAYRREYRARKREEANNPEQQKSIGDS